jgi:hypothetical protein
VLLNHSAQKVGNPKNEMLRANLLGWFDFAALPPNLRFGHASQLSYYV